MLSKNSPNRLLVDTLKLASKLVLCKAKFAVNHIDCSIRVFIEVVDQPHCRLRPSKTFSLGCGNKVLKIISHVYCKQ